MRRPPQLRLARQFPTTSTVAVTACTISALWWAGRDVSWTFLDARAWYGEPWRLALSALPHVDIIHLAFNVYWLWVFGTAVEAAFGSVRTALLLLALAAPSAAAEYALLDGGVGLSGVGYGLFGLLWWFNSRDARFAGVIDAKTIQIFVAWFFICIALTVTGVMPAGNVAHASGFGMGMLIGAAASASGARRRSRVAAACIVLALTLAGATIARRWVNLSAYTGADSAILGYNALIARDYVLAQTWLQRAIDQNPTEPTYWHNLGLAFQGLEQRGAAADAYRHALTLDASMECRATLVALNVALANEAMEQGRHEEAIRLCRESIALDQDDSYAWYNLGRALSLIGAQTEACDALRKAAALNPNDAVMQTAMRSICDATPTTQHDGQ